MMKRFWPTALLLATVGMATLVAAGLTTVSFGSALPSSCLVRNIFIKTSATAGLYWCSATDTWSAVASGAGTVTTTGSPSSGQIAKFSGSTSITNAASGTDYAPATSGSAILKGNGSGGFTSAASGTDYAPATSGSSPLFGSGSGGFSNGTVQGNTTKVVTYAGSAPSTNDCAKFDSSGNVTTAGAACGAGGGGGLTLLEQHTASSSATLDFTSFISSTYDDYLFRFVAMLPATDSVEFRMIYGSGGGPTWDTGNHYWSDGNIGAYGTTGASYALLSPNCSNNAFRLMSGWFNLADLQNTGSVAKLGYGQMSLFNSSATYKNNTVGSAYDNSSIAAAVTGVRFLYSSGNIASGTIRVYGISK